MSTAGLFLIKGLLVLLLAAAALNDFRVLIGAIGSVLHKNEPILSSVQKAGSLWTWSAVSIWLTAVLIYFMERILTGIPTQYSAILLFMVGLLLLGIAVISVAAAVTVSMSRAENGSICGSTLKKFALLDSVFAILIWISAWAVI